MKPQAKWALLFSCICIFIFSITSYAGRIDRRQRHERQRIRTGVANGSLTKKEAAGLRKEQREIRKMKKDARSDGHISREERKSIRNEQNEASKNIYQEKHDEETKQ